MGMDSTTYTDLSLRECPECGNKNGPRTQKMLDDHRALKECYGCGHRCVVNYQTKKLEGPYNDNQKDQ